MAQNRAFTADVEGAKVTYYDGNGEQGEHAGIFQPLAPMCRADGSTHAQPGLFVTGETKRPATLYRFENVDASMRHAIIF